MSDVASQDVSGVLERQQSAEEWRVLGERLRRSNPALYERVFAFFVLSIPSDPDTDITKSYFIT